MLRIGYATPAAIYHLPRGAVNVVLADVLKVILTCGWCDGAYTVDVCEDGITGSKNSIRWKPSGPGRCRCVGWTRSSCTRLRVDAGDGPRLRLTSYVCIGSIVILLVGCKGRTDSVAISRTGWANGDEKNEQPENGLEFHGCTARSREWAE